MGLCRRDFLATAATMAATLPSCAFFDAAEAPLLSLEELKSKRRHIADFNGDAVFVGLDDRDCPYILSLVCTHKKCTVGFKPELDGFLCPCHKGRYDRYGRVVSGKPPRPLDRFDLQERDGIVWVLNRRPA